MALRTSRRFGGLNRLLLAIACAHAFQQGNKCTGFIAAEIFLDANGWLLNMDGEDIADEIVAAIEDASLEPALAALFREHMIETVE